MSRRAVSLFLFLTVLLACQQRAPQAPVIGVCYAGPATLNLRKDIPLQSPVVTTVKHGDRLFIIQHRRRFMKVRTGSGVEGWTEDHLLLSAEDMAMLRAFSKDVHSLPSQGVATTYEPLNVHTEPDRQSPSFIQLKENEKFDVIAHRVAARAAQPRKPLIPPPPKRVRQAKKKRESGRVPPPPMPAAPSAPANWLDLSRTPPEILAERAAAKEAQALPADDWSLIRTARGESGWVLTRRLFMAIPDEVAQYAEGRRISSYFPLGDVHDGNQVKHNWLWTTIAGSQQYDFDSFRVFIWSLRRHRYETAYIERNLRGYFPVLMEQVAYGAPPKEKGAAAAATNLNPGFSVCVDKKDGTRVRKSYVFLGNVVRLAGSKPCQISALENPKVPIETFVASAEQLAEPGGRSLGERVRAKLRKWFGR